MKIDDNKISNLLPVGYLFLVFLGLIKESLIYNQIGINILSYSSISDIMLSPIVDLTTNFVFLPTILILAVILYYLFVVYAFKKREKKWVKKDLLNVKEEFWERPEKEIKSSFLNIYIIFISLFICSMYVGNGWARGKDISQDIKNDNLEFHHILTYLYSDETMEISLIGANSVNYFYLVKGENNVKISPVTAIKTLEILNVEKDKDGRRTK